jgi:transcriptional regulator with XRE-family HTH domain
VPPRTSADPSVAAFGAAVRTAREARKLSVEQLARDIPRMDAAYLAAVERGWHAVTIPTALRIAAALRMDLSDLVRDLGPVSETREGVLEATR